MAEATLSILVKAVGAAKAAKDLKGIDATISRIGAHAGQGLRTAAANIARLGVVAAGASIALGVGAVKAAADFESQLHTINTVAAVTPDKLAAIGDGIRQIARDTGTPLADLTQGFYDLVSAGVAADQAQRVLASSNRLAIGGLGTAAEGVDLLTTALNSYGVAAQQQGAESERFADIFAKAIEKGKVTAAELAGSFATIGPIAAKSGISIEELAAGYATLTAQGVPAAEAATQMRSALVGLLSPNAKLNEIQKKTKLNFAAMAKEKGLVVALERLRKEAAKAGIPLIDVLGRVEGFNFAVSATGDNLAAYNEDLRDMGDSANTAARQMAERQQGLNYQLARLKALALDAGITIGSKLLPKLTPIAERIVAFLQTHQPDIERFGDEIARGFDKAAAFAERIPWEVVGSGLKTAATWAERLMGVFLAMPPQVQGTIVALAGLNKLTGGAVGGIVTELGKGLIKGVLGMTAGVVNINAGVVNGPGNLPGNKVVPPIPAPLLPLVAPFVFAGDVAPGGRGSPVGEGPDFQAMLLRMQKAGRGAEKISSNETVDEALARLGLGAPKSGGRTRPLEGSAGFNAKFLAPDVRAERAALERFTASTAPSMRSMEAHLARLREIQARTPAEDRTNTTAIVNAINSLRSAMSVKPVVNVNVTARSVERATVSWRRTASVSRVGID